LDGELVGKEEGDAGDKVEDDGKEVDLVDVDGVVVDVEDGVLEEEGLW